MIKEITLEEIKNICYTLYSVAEIPMYLYSSHNCQLILHLPGTDLLKAISSSVFQHVADSMEKKSSTLPQIFITEESISYAVFSLSVEQKTAYLLVGPCFSESLPVHMISGFLRRFYTLPAKDHAELLTFFPASDPEYFLSVVRLLYYMLYQKTLDSARLAEQSSDYNFDYSKAKTEETLFERRETAIYHTPRIFEEMMLEKVKNGDINAKPAFDYAIQAGKPGLLSNNPLRNEKNLFISLVTLVTRAAISGGLAEERAYSMSDTYIQASEEAKDIHRIGILSDQMIYDFTNEVRKSQTKKFPPDIETTLDYIHKHLHEKITLESASTVARLSVSQLSRKFKKEVGLSFVEYIQQERVKSASNMLRFSNYSILEISNYLNFSSQSYFIDIFKKHTGETPSQYRNSHANSRYYFRPDNLQ